jgi:phenylacetate-CoA ligase
MSAANNLPLISGLPGIVWPGIPGQQAAILAALLFQFEQTQWWSPQQIVEHQFAQLRPLLIHAHKYVPFYRRLFDESGFNPTEHDIRKRWESIPITTRKQLQEAGDSCYSASVPPEHGSIATNTTSGSTGRPLVSRKTALCDMLWWALTIREHLWHARDLTGRLAVIRARAPDFPREGVTSNDWGQPVNLLYSSGPSAALNASEEIDTQWSWLQRQDPHYLLSHPTVVRALAEHAVERGCRLQSLREIRTVGESVTQELRQRCLDVFRVPTVDSYSAQEVGYIALQCKQSPCYHVQSECVLVEVLDEQDRPCAPGEIGRIIVTRLHNFAMPLIRYEIHDYAEVGEPCRCGRGLPVLNKIVGRQRNMMRRPDGRRSWLAFSPKGYLPIAPIAQLQLIQRQLTDFEARIVMPRALTDIERVALTNYLQSHIGFACAITITCVRGIERAANVKFEDFISLVD